MPLNRPLARSGRPAWGLRLLLGGVGAGLVAVAVAVSTVPAPSQPVAVAPPASVAPTLPATTTTTSTAPPTTSAAGSGAKSATPPTSAAPTTAPASDPRPPGWSGSGCALSLTSRPAVAPVGHCTVLEIGDSLGNDLGWGLQRHLSPASGLHLIEADVSSTGLVDRSFYDWPAHLATDLHRYHPQLVLASLGGNDEQGMVIDGSVQAFGTSAWQRAYLAKVTALVREATDAGAYVLWVGLPVMQQPGFSAGIATLDTLYARAAATDRYATYLSTWELFSRPGVGFAAAAEVNGASAQVREPDGVHYGYAGEDVVATYVIRHLAASFHVRLAPQSPAVITGW